MPQQPQGDWFDQNSPAQDLFDRAAATDGHPQNQVTITPDQPVTITPDEDLFDRAAKGDWFEQNAPGRTAVPKLKQPVKVESSTADTLLGALAPQTVQKTTKRTSPTQITSFEGSYSSGDTDKAAAMTGTAIAAGAALTGVAAAPRAIAAAKALGTWISENPVKAFLLYEAAKDFIPDSVRGLFKAAKKVPAE